MTFNKFNASFFVQNDIPKLISEFYIKFMLHDQNLIELLYAVHRGEVRFVSLMNSKKVDSGNHDERKIKILIENGLIKSLKSSVFLTDFVLTNSGLELAGIKNVTKKEITSIIQ